MKKKSEIEKLVSQFKKQKRTDLNVKVTEAFKAQPFRERDMREESIQMGVHGASEMWGINP